MLGKRPANTEVTTRWRGGSGGTCGARNNWPRKRRSTPADCVQGLTSDNCSVPCVGRCAQASTCSKVVLPAPDGPMMATCSPAPKRRFKARKAAGAPGSAAGCRASKAESSIFTDVVLRL